MKKILLFLAGLLLAIHANAWTTTKDAADRLGADQVKEVTFEKSATGLSEAQKVEIRAAISEASKKGKIDEVKVLAWSDKEYPTESGKPSKSDINLAKDRLKDLKAFLKDELKVSDVDTYNMSERPNAIEKFFHTSDSKVKNAAEAEGAAPTAGNTGLFDMKAQAAKGVVMIFMKK